MRFGIRSASRGNTPWFAFEFDDLGGAYGFAIKVGSRMWLVPIVWKRRP